MKEKKKLSDSGLYQYLQKRRKNIKIRSVLLALFVLGVNIYAWFIYFTEAQVNITGNVVSWDVSFRDENSQVVEKEIIADINMYPGMPDYSKTLKILNASELPAKFSYEIEEMTLMGEDIKAGMTTEQLETELRESYPFVVNFISDKDSMNIGEEMSFTFDVAWPFENAEGENNYYKLNNYYSYDPSVTYFQYNGFSYDKANITSSSDFGISINSLYLEKDDADSFWGMMCGSYEKETNKACLTIKLKLRVVQSG